MLAKQLLFSAAYVSLCVCVCLCVCPHKKTPKNYGQWRISTRALNPYPAGLWESSKSKEKMWIVGVTGPVGPNVACGPTTRNTIVDTDMLPQLKDTKRSLAAGEALRLRPRLQRSARVPSWIWGGASWREGNDTESSKRTTDGDVFTTADQAVA